MKRIIQSRILSNKTLVLLLILLSVIKMNLAQTPEQEKPFLSIGVLSDIHNQESLINAPFSNIKLRGVFLTTIEKIKNEEDIDMLIFNGDYTSDVTITEPQFNRVRELMVETGRSVFNPELSRKPVIYVNGNHDYEVANFDRLPKLYNAGDFYTTPMMTDIGELNEHNSFYEYADNGDASPMRLLAAFHYVIEGFDFIVLNTGKYFFQSAWDYRFSEESVRWTKNKLAEIYSEDPDKTVFFLCHLPFQDSKGISNSNKGIKDDVATSLLKNTLAMYPNIIYLYGHDHGSNSAYFRSSTDERVTEYGSDANRLNENSKKQDEHLFYIQSTADNTYLGSNSYNLFPLINEATCTIRSSSTAKYFNIIVPSSHEPNLYCGSSGRFSLNSSVTNLRLFRVTSNSANIITAEQIVDGKIILGEEYLIVGLDSSSSAPYALTNEPYSSGSSSQRLIGVPVNINGTQLTYTNTSSKYSPIWKIYSQSPSKALTVQDISGKFLGAGDDNLNVNTQSSICTFSHSNQEGYFNITTQDFIKTNAINVFCETNGYFSLNSSVSNLRLFKVKSIINNTITAEQIIDIEDLESRYLIIGHHNGNNYALTNKQFTGNGTTNGNTRLWGTPVTITDNILTYTDDDIADNFSALWKFNNYKPEKSFVTAFVGSMRYYNNSIDSSVGASNSRIVQAMMIYAYQDSIVLKIKNYGEHGTINGITINKNILPYTITRPIKGTKPDEPRLVTVGVSPEYSEMGSVKILSHETLSVNTRDHVTVEATAIDDYQFQKWIDTSTNNVISFKNPYTYKGFETINLAAVFNPKTHLNSLDQEGIQLIQDGQNLIIRGIKDYHLSLYNITGELIHSVKIENDSQIIKLNNQYAFLIAKLTSRNGQSKCYKLIGKK